HRHLIVTLYGDDPGVLNLPVKIRLPETVVGYAFQRIGIAVMVVKLHVAVSGTIYKSDRIKMQLCTAPLDDKVVVVFFRQRRPKKLNNSIFEESRKHRQLNRKDHVLVPQCEKRLA